MHQSISFDLEAYFGIYLSCFIRGVFMFGKVIYNECTKTCKAFTTEELEQMNREMIGKSQKECQEIIKKHNK